MKWIDNTYCQDNGFFTGGIYGQNTGGKYPAWYAGDELGKFLEVADAKFAIELAHARKTRGPLPVRIRLGPVDHTRKAVIG